MNNKLLSWLLLFCALGLSGTAAYYSVYGLSIIFSGVAIPVIIMGSFLEVSKIAIATYLHDTWKKTYGLLKIYLTTAILVLSILTSIGIYGLLATGFQKSIAGLEINNKKIDNIEVKKGRFEKIKEEHQKEKKVLDSDITNLRNALSTNTTTQTVDRQSGQVITRANAANRNAFEKQLRIAQQSRDIISSKIDAINDSITSLDILILDISSKEIETGELGAIKYLSEITGWEIKKTANFFILTLIFVFDPLAIALVIATNQSFRNYRRRKEDEEEIKPENKKYPFQDEIEVPESYLTYVDHNIPQVEPEIVEKIVEVERIVEVPIEIPVEVDRIVEVEKIVEVPVEVQKVVEVEKLIEVVREVPIEKIIEVPVEKLVEVIKEVPVEKIVEVPVEIPYKYYVNDMGQVFDQDGNQIDQILLEKKLEKMEKKVLKYKK